MSASRFNDLDPSYSGDPAMIWVAVRTMVAKPSWHADARCRERPDLPWVSDKTSPEMHAKMQAICAGCSVRDECAADVELHGFTTFGCWAGQSRQERSKGKRQAA